MRFRNALALLLGASALCLPAWADESSPANFDPAAETSVASTIQPLSLTQSQPMMLADKLAVSAKSAYKGGRGLVSLSGETGMFLNPTSGTLNQGQFTAQYCLFVNGYNAGTVVAHGFLFAYGVTDWLEVGEFSNIAEIDGVNRSWCDDPFAVTGPFVRVRLTKEEGWIPELSIGAIYLDGSARGDLLAKTEVFLAASKSWQIDPDGFCRSVRAHGGFRYISRHEAPDLPKSVRLGTDLSMLYGGIEIEFPYSIYFISEVGTPDLFDRKQSEAWPYAVGFQWKPNSVLGISIAHANPEELGLRDGFWFGIGLNFKF